MSCLSMLCQLFAFMLAHCVRHGIPLLRAHFFKSHIVNDCFPLSFWVCSLLFPMHIVRVYGFLCSSCLNTGNVVSLFLLHMCISFFVYDPLCSQCIQCVCTGSCAHRSWVREMLCHESYSTCAFCSLCVISRRVTLKARACGNTILSRMALVYCLRWVQFVRCVFLWFGFCSVHLFLSLQLLAFSIAWTAVLGQMVRVF